MPKSPQKESGVLTPEGCFSIPRALSIARGIAEGLGAAHAKGIVHRDIKPENILLTSDNETPKLLDFGIAAMKESATAVSRTHGLLLTPPYAAPEQWKGLPAEDLDARTDLYALGCVLYEMLTGQTPFQASNTEGWMYQHLQEEPQPPVHLRPELTDWPGLDALVLRLLAKDREQRPVAAPELVGLLDAVRYVAQPARRETVKEDEASRGKHAIGNRPKRVPVWAWITSIVLLILAASAVRFGSHRPRQLEGSAQKTTPVIQIPQSTQTEQDSNSEPSVPRAKQVEGPKPSVQKAGIAETEQQAEAFYDQKRYSDAKPLFDQACTGGNADACFHLGKMYGEGFGVQQDYTQALPLYSKACEKGNAKGCNNLGVLYAGGHGVAQDYSRASALYTRACDAGDPMGCGNLGNSYASGKGVTQDYPQAIALFTKACDAGTAKACTGLGSMYLGGQGVTQDYQRAVTPLSKACDAGDPMGCNDLGVIYHDGHGVDRDYSRAATLYSKACEAGVAMGCSNLGGIYERGDGVAQDYSRAVALYSKSCDAAYGNGCNRLGLMYLFPHGVVQDFSHAAALFSRACNIGSANGCSNLGDAYRRGWGVGQDKEKAKEFLNKGCSMGDRAGCDELGQLP